MRNLKTDACIEHDFGKPDYSRSFKRNGKVLTPFNSVNLYRVDTFEDFFLRNGRGGVLSKHDGRDEGNPGHS